MKKTFIIALLITLVCGSCFAVENLGDYTLDKVDNPLVSGLITDMENNGWLDAFLAYGIFKDDNGWKILFADDANENNLIIRITDSYVQMARYSDIDFSSVSEYAFLKAVNDYVTKTASWASFVCVNGELAADLRLTITGLTVEMLEDQFFWFSIAAQYGFTSIAESLGL